jgi:hypothetical protein
VQPQHVTQTEAGAHAPPAHTYDKQTPRCMRV